MTTPLCAALALARQDFWVFPVRTSKAPACPGGFKAASNEPAEVERLWRAYPAPLVGVATDAASGFDVLDIDVKSGGLDWLAAHRDRIPPTRTHSTRSGGKHLLFRHLEGMPCSAGRVAPGVDVRGDGGYVVWWPAAGLPIEDHSPMAEWPEWIAEIALHPRTPRRGPADPAPRPRPPLVYRPAPMITDARAERYALAALRNAAGRVADAPVGGRNDVLNRETWNVTRRFLDVLGPDRIADAMVAAGIAAGLPTPEVVGTVTSALGAAGVE